MSPTNTYAELRLISQDRERPLLASASPVVPLLWLGLFDYDDTSVTRDDAMELLNAGTSVALARQRARDLMAALPGAPPQLGESAGLLVEALDRAPVGGRLSLDATKVLSGMMPREGQSQVQRLVNLCDVLERLRKGMPWQAAQGHLARLKADLSAVAAKEPDQARDGLVGQPVSAPAGLADCLVRTGQGRQDLVPEALAAGNGGLLLGRFKGKWKLMSSGVTRDLRGIWGKDDTAFLVGAAGTVLRLEQGRCATMQVPVKRDLNAVWGISARMVCVVGDGGDVLMFTGRSWQPWVVPGDGDLHAITGSGPESICIAGSDSAVLSFDGYSWDRAELPEASVANRLCCVNGVIHAAGRSRWGGELFRKEGDTFVQDKTLPTANSLEGIWEGWGKSFGVAPTTGAALFFDGSGWSTEDMPADQIFAAAAGAETMAVGRSGSYSVILIRAEEGWRVEASLRGQRLNAVWVMGSPRPPRLALDEEPRDA